MPSTTIDAHQEDTDDGQVISWPAATLSPVSAGDYILANYGSQNVYANSDGGYSVTFGSTYSPGSWGIGTGSFTINGHTYHYNGPYCHVAPADIDLEDEAFADIEILDAIDYVQDPYTGEWPNLSRSGPKGIHGNHVVSGAIGRRHKQATDQGRHLHSSLQLTFSGSVLTVINGVIQLDDSSTVYSVTGPATLSINALDWIVYDTTQGSSGVLSNLTSSHPDFSLDSNTKYIILGRVSTSVDRNGNYYTTGWHHGPHIHTDAHIRPEGLFGEHLNNGAIIATQELGSSVAMTSGATHGTFRTSVQQSSTISISQNTFNALSTGQWLIACGVDLGSGVSSPGSPYAQPIASYVSAGTGKTLDGLPATSPVLWDGVTAQTFGMTVQSVAVSSTTLTITWQGICIDGNNENGTIHVWFQWLGVTP